MTVTSIEWTDATWNPVRGCTKVSPGCANCYASTFAERFRGVPGHAYEQGFDLRLVPEKLAEPLSWRKPRRVFVNSMSDLFQDGAPDTYIDQVFAVMALTPQHTYQVLTKRPERMLAYITRLAKSIAPIEKAARDLGHSFAFEGMSLLRWPIPNVWLGTSIENQHFADERIPILLETPAAIRFISAEPLLEGLDLAKHRIGALGLGWCIVGGESGPGARPCHTWWIKNIIGQCRDADVPVFVKQMGALPLVKQGRQQHWEWRHIQRDERHRLLQHDDADWRVNLTDRKGGIMDEWPPDLRVREFPSNGAK